MSDFNAEEAKKELKINKYDLAEEWANQPNLFMKYSLKMSNLINKKELLRSSLTTEIILNPDKHGMAKLTETGVGRVLDTNEELIAIQLQINLYKGAVSAFEHKKKALEYECQLLIGGFFSEPKEKKPIKRKWRHEREEK